VREWILGNFAPWVEMWARIVNGKKQIVNKSILKTEAICEARFM
jgi:hypothetical protein